MEARELRIGNWVEYPNWSNNKDKCIFEIGGISKLNDEITVTKGLIKIASKNIYYFKPIPLTEEWLLKFGYIPCDLTENHFNIAGHRIWKCNDMFLCDKTGVILDYVHSLQNLFFALNKKELTIKQS